MQQLVELAVAAGPLPQQLLPLMLILETNKQMVPLVLACDSKHPGRNRFSLVGNDTTKGLSCQNLATKNCFHC